ncbi:MAG: peroxiredoxin [Alphaproteobacteria bacterium]|jgi:peroxiredoxin Q/BCP|nr:peroxiredoxin [Alphaproteobacteria bacterium]
MTKQLQDFTLQGIDAQGVEQTYTKNSFLGKKLVVYFYPKDNTPGCTKEACNFNAILPQIMAMANIIGVSADSIASHKKFREDHSLAFPLLSDVNLSLATHLGALKEDNNKILRSTFIIDESGNVIKEWLSVKVDGHDTAVLDMLKALKV